MAEKKPDVYWKVRVELTTEIEVLSPQGDEEAAKEKARLTIEEELGWNDFEPDRMYADEKGGPFDLKLPIKGKKSWRTWHLKSLTREEAELEAIQVADDLRKSSLKHWQECDYLKREVVDHRHNPGMT